MMGRKGGVQGVLFSYNINLDSRVRKDHLLRKIKETVDFDFMYKEVEGTYGMNGNVSVPPPVILKMMLLLFLYDVRSERELMETIPERMDWMWFLGYTIDDEIPNHSVLSKARSRWGVEAFGKFFETIVWQCVERGLVGGDKLFVDASIIHANASNDSLTIREDIRRKYVEIEGRLDEKYVSRTDPDATVSRKRGGKSRLSYKTHRGVDPAYEVITSTLLTTGNKDDGQMLEEVISTHESNTQSVVDTVVADSGYGTIDNYMFCHDRGISAHIPSLSDRNEDVLKSKEKYCVCEFEYKAEEDIYICPSGQRMRKSGYNKERSCNYYTTERNACSKCSLRDQCTDSRQGRRINRHVRQVEIDLMRKEAKSAVSKKDIKRRQDLSERSFARSKRYGYKDSRWRGLWRVRIQDYLIAAIQNILILIKNPSGKHTVEKKQEVYSCSRPEKKQFLVDAMGMSHTLLNSIKFFSQSVVFYKACYI